MARRWARHWLDVARYAEDQAHTFGVKPKTKAWRLPRLGHCRVQRRHAVRPVREAANCRRPDVRSQATIRSPSSPASASSASARSTTRTRAKEQAIAEELDDRVDVVTRGFLGLTVSCARCHDHKFDPIPTRDYYSLAGIFYGHGPDRCPALPARGDEGLSRQRRTNLKKAEEKLKKAQAAAKAKPGTRNCRRPRRRWPRRSRGSRRRCRSRRRGPRRHRQRAGMKIYIRGNPATKGEDAPKGFLQVLPCSCPRRRLHAARSRQRDRQRGEPADGPRDCEPRLGVALRPRARQHAQ